MGNKRSQGELNRSRGMFLVASYEEDRVSRISSGAWLVRFDLGLKEWIKNRIVKDTALSYAIKVVRYEISQECNPWGLALDAHAHAPKRIE